jgi:hypothetical protein
MTSRRFILTNTITIFEISESTCSVAVEFYFHSLDQNLILKIQIIKLVAIARSLATWCLI